MKRKGTRHKSSAGPGAPRSTGGLPGRSARRSVLTGLLACGIAAPIWWIVNDVVGSLRHPGYSYVDQTISELSATGAPTRTFMMTVSGIPYTILMLAFGAGVWLSAGRSRLGKAVGSLLAFEAVFGFVGGLAFPMASRETIAAGGATKRQRLHEPYGVGMPLLFTSVIVLGSRWLGRRFRWFSYATIVVMMVFGFLNGKQTGQLKANQPTPRIGVVERITAYTPLLWIVVLAVALMTNAFAEPDD